MYHHHFGLSGPPFQFNPNPAALYLSHTHREALAALEWGLLHEPTGFTLLAGESGVGKTTLICSILARRYRSVRSALLTNPRLDFDQTMQVVMSQLAPGFTGQTRWELTEGFVQLLEDTAPGDRIAIVLDEAQGLSDEALEGMRLLSNADTFEERRLQIILAGQPELVDRLAQPAMHSLNQRIGARALLKALRQTEARDYIDCRLRARGGSARKIFAPAALNHLIAHGGGIPRRLNVLCHNSMLAGYAAGSKKVTLAMVKDAVGEYESLLSTRDRRERADANAHRPKWRAALVRAAVAITALALAAAGALLARSQAWLTLNPSRAAISEAAIRSAAEPYFTGPGIPLRPVAPRAEDEGLNVTLRPPGAQVR